ncbi:hypothetical protein K9L27_04800, partial [Candidatus Gracilibacteria bacterium]|nr:hypothetical protein [Candidatus Gracilibacteria bacterium]
MKSLTILFIVFFSTLLYAQPFIGWETYQVSGKVQVVYVDHLNNKWFSSWESGVYKFDGNNWENLNTQNSGLLSNKIYSIFEDNQHNMWFGDYNGA